MKEVWRIDVRMRGDGSFEVDAPYRSMTSSMDRQLEHVRATWTGYRISGGGPQALAWSGHYERWDSWFASLFIEVDG